MKRSLEGKLLNPRPGSKAAAAKEAGVDLTMLLRNLRLTPQERIEKLERIAWLQHEISERVKRFNNKT
jgi:hypothetical protein